MNVLCIYLIEGEVEAGDPNQFVCVGFPAKADPEIAVSVRRVCTGAVISLTHKVKQPLGT